MRLVPLALAGCLIAVACSDSMSPSDYESAWKQSLTAYRAIQKDPSQAAGSDDQVGISQASHSISESIRDISRGLNELKPPAQYATLNEDTYLFYRGQADDYLGYASALGTGDSSRIDAAMNAINDFATQEHQKIDDDITKLGKDGEPFKAAWKDAFNAPNTATTPPPVAPPPTTKKPSKKVAHKHKK